MTPRALLSYARLHSTILDSFRLSNGVAVCKQGHDDAGRVCLEWAECFTLSQLRDFIYS